MNAVTEHCTQVGETAWGSERRVYGSHASQVRVSHAYNPTLKSAACIVATVGEGELMSFTLEVLGAANGNQRHTLSEAPGSTAGVRFNRFKISP